MPTLTGRYPIRYVLPDRIVCGGFHATADNQGPHDLLNKTFFLSQITPAAGTPPPPIQVDDVIATYDDGSAVHVPVAH